MMLPAQPPQFFPAQLQAIVEQMRPQQAAPQLDAARLQAVIEQIRMQREAQQNPLAEAFVGIVRVVAVGAAIGLGVAAIGSLFGNDDEARERARLQRARNRRLNGPRGRVNVVKTGICTCCGKRFRYTEVHHYAGRAVPRGREMCGRCHFYCGHNGNWKNYAINPKGCWLDSFK